MTRRDFLLRSALAGFTILPGTGRIWKAVRETPIEFVPGPPASPSLKWLFDTIYRMQMERQRFGVPAEKSQILTLFP